MLVLELFVYSFLLLLLQAYCESWGFCPSQHFACQWCHCKSQVIHWDCKFLFFQSKLIAISFFSLWSIQTLLKHDPYILSGHLSSLLLYYVTCSSVTGWSCWCWWNRAAVPEENGAALCYVQCTRHLIHFFQRDPGHYAYSEDWWAWTPFLLNTQTADLVSTLVLVLDPNDQISFSIRSQLSY